MSDRKKLRKLLREFVSEVVTAGEFNDNDIRPVGNYRPEGNYRPADNYRPVDNYRTKNMYSSDDPKVQLGMAKAQPEVPPEDGDQEVNKGGEGATSTTADKGPTGSAPYPGGEDDESGDETADASSTATVDVKQPEWKNPLI
jgi:hypothetical protein